VGSYSSRRVQCRPHRFHQRWFVNCEADAADKIDGYRAFRILDGYYSIPLALLRSIPDYEATIHLNSMVESVGWRPGRAEVNFNSALSEEKIKLRCRQLVITAPLGVLQERRPSAGCIQFDPEPEAALKAARSLKFGQVYRVTLRFREAFWEEDEKGKSAGFLVSQDKRFFTWWTTHPVLVPLLTGWMAGSAADEFSASTSLVVVGEAVKSLARILKRKIPSPEGFIFTIGDPILTSGAHRAMFR
jgi:hypothetical protein